MIVNFQKKKHSSKKKGKMKKKSKQNYMGSKSPLVFFAILLELE